MTNMNNAIFFIRSPFQMLCAINALYTFKLKGDFVIIREADDRYLQIEKMAKENDLNYSLISPVEMPMLDTYSKLFVNALKKSNAGHGFDYVFVGDYRNINTTAYAISFANRNAKLYYLDDGTNMIPLLQDKHIWTKTEKVKKLCNVCLSRIKGIKEENYYTIYSDIKNNKYRIINNDMNHIVVDSPKTNTVLFIGTSSEVYCRSLGILKARYLEIFRQIIRDIRVDYSGFDIIYIPHGRDKMQEIFDICEEEKVELKKLDVCIEYYISMRAVHPSIVAGFGSNALFTLRKMLPDSTVINYFVNGSNSALVKAYDDVRKYYEDNGIRTIYIE